MTVRKTPMSFTLDELTVLEEALTYYVPGHPFEKGIRDPENVCALLDRIASMRRIAESLEPIR